MNRKKTIILFLSFIILIAGSSILYQVLKNKADLPSPIMTPSSTEAVKESSQSSSESQESSAPASESEAPEVLAAPDFSMIDKDGTTVKLSDFIGKPIVMNFWASWCPPCKAEMPDFDKVYQELGEEVTFLMIDMTDGTRETKEKAQKHVDDQGYTFPVYFDINQEAAYAYGVSSIPSTYFIDKDGNLVTRAQGAIDEETLRLGISYIYTGSAE